MIRTSIVIPTHNRAEMVRAAIESVLALPGADARELIVVNDGSTDHTPEVLRSYGDRLKVLSTRHGERSRARNAGLEAATGELVAFLDDDDVFLPSGLEYLEAALLESPAEVGIVYGMPQYEKVDPDCPLTGTLPPGLGVGGWVLPRLLCNNFLVVGNLVARRSVLRKLGGFDSEWPPVEDYHLWVRVASSYRIEYRDVEVARIRLHGGNSSNDMDRSYWKSEGVREQYLLTSGCLADAKRRALAGHPPFWTELARVCLDLSRQRWWQGNIDVSRRAYLQALRLCPITAVREMGELWRAWLPHRRMTAAGLK